MLLTSKPLIALLSSVLLIGCFSTGKVDMLEDPYSDASYIEKYKSYTKEIKVYDNFETKLTATVTHLSPDFLVAFKLRYEAIYDEPASYLTEAGAGTGFFVSAFVPGETDIDLADTHLWTLRLVLDGKKIGPSMIRKLQDKARWSPFFTGTDPWTTEFLIVFDTDETLPEGKTRLTFSNSSVKAEAIW